MAIMISETEPLRPKRSLGISLLLGVAIVIVLGILTVGGMIIFAGNVSDDNSNTNDFMMHKRMPLSHVRTADNYQYVINAQYKANCNHAQLWWGIHYLDDTLKYDFASIDHTDVSKAFLEQEGLKIRHHINTHIKCIFTQIHPFFE